METDCNGNVVNNSVNINRNKQIYEGLRKYLAKFSLVRRILFSSLIITKDKIL